ncbi:MAG: universal stress protein [Ignavibacteriales bacterium]|nr:universal stress protein [Ignavibacteriales bacterium]
MEKIFKCLGLAITFSPTGKALLMEAKRLRDLFDSKIVFIHVGEKNKEKEKQLVELIGDAGFSKDSFQLEWAKGDIANAIVKKCVETNIDLLIAGALEKENFVKYYFGSVARKLMREAPCSLLIYISPSESPKSFKKFSVSVDYTPRCEETIKIAHKFALLDKAKEFILVRDFQAPALAMTVQDAGSTEEAERIRSEWEKEEHDKMNMLVKELNLTGININIVTLFGKEGWEANRFVGAVQSDIFVVSSPEKRLTFLDRIFQHDLEFTIKELPCPLMLIKTFKNT